MIDWLSKCACDDETICTEHRKRRCTGRDGHSGRCENDATMVATGSDGVQWFACDAHATGSAQYEPLDRFFQRVILSTRHIGEGS